MLPPCVLMYILDDKNNIKFFVRWFIYFIAASFVAVGLGLNFSDDGLRHIAFAANENIMHNWGEVFPYSLFGEYDPWYFWHHLLKFFIDISSYENVHIVVNIVSVFILLILIDAIMNIEMKKYKNLIILLSLIMLSSVFDRYVNLRPDLLSGFYVMSIYIIFKKTNAKYRFLVVFIASLIYIPMYYLFFVYSIAMAMYMFMMKDYKSMLSLFVATAIGFAFYYLAFGKEALDVIMNVLNDEKLRDGLTVAEGQPLFSMINLLNVKVLLLVYLAGMLYLKFTKQELLTQNALLTLLLTLSLLWIGQLRYTFLFMPLFYIFSISLFFNLDRKKLHLIFLKIEKYFVLFFKITQRNNKNVSFILVFSLFVAFEMGMVFYDDHKDASTCNRSSVSEFKKQDYNNSTILFVTLGTDTYLSLYANPTIKTVPSCSIGWLSGDKNLHKIYRKMLNDEIEPDELAGFAKKINADYIFVDLPINKNKELNIDLMNKNGYKIFKIFKRYLIFIKN